MMILWGSLLLYGLRPILHCNRMISKLRSKAFAWFPQLYPIIKPYMHT